MHIRGLNPNIKTTASVSPKQFSGFEDESVDSSLLRLFFPLKDTSMVFQHPVNYRQETVANTCTNFASVSSIPLRVQITTPVLRFFEK